MVAAVTAATIVVIIMVVVVVVIVVVVVVVDFVVQVHATLNYTKILSVEQVCFYVEFMSLATKQIICDIF
jgi:hypothetical protein